MRLVISNNDNVFRVRYAHIVHILILLLSILSIFDVFFTKYVFQYGVGVLQKIFILLVFAVQVVINIPRGQFFFPKNLIIFLAVSILIGLVSSLNSGISEWSMYQVFLTFQGFLLLFVLCNLDTTEHESHVYLKVFLVLAGIVFLLSIVELIDREAFYRIFQVGEIHEQALTRGKYIAVQSVFGHPGLYSWYMAYAFSISCAFLLKKNKYIYATLMIIFSIGVVLSLRRKSIFSLIVVFTLFIILFLEKRNRKTILLLGSCVLVIVPALFIEQIQYIVNKGVAHYISGEYYSPRNLLYVAAIHLANEYFPLGTGFGTYGSWMSRIHYSDLYYTLNFHENYGMTPNNGKYLTDTYWPMIIGELGWIGCLSMLLLWYSLLRRLIMNYRKSKRQSNQIVHCAASLALVQVMVESIASPSLSKAPEIFFVMLLVGISFRLSMKEKRNESIAMS